MTPGGSTGRFREGDFGPQPFCALILQYKLIVGDPEIQPQLQYEFTSTAVVVLLS